MEMSPLISHLSPLTFASTGCQLVPLEGPRVFHPVCRDEAETLQLPEPGGAAEASVEPGGLRAGLGRAWMERGFGETLWHRCPGGVRSWDWYQSIGDPWPDTGFAAFQTNKQTNKSLKASQSFQQSSSSCLPGTSSTPKTTISRVLCCFINFYVFNYFLPESIWDKVLPTSEDLLGGPGEGRENSFVYW